MKLAAPLSAPGGLKSPVLLTQHLRKQARGIGQGHGHSGQNAVGSRRPQLVLEAGRGFIQVGLAGAPPPPKQSVKRPDPTRPHALPLPVRGRRQDRPETGDGAFGPLGPTSSTDPTTLRGTKEGRLDAGVPGAKSPRGISRSVRPRRRDVSKVAQHEGLTDTQGSFPLENDSTARPHSGDTFLREKRDVKHHSLMMRHSVERTRLHTNGVRAAAVVGLRLRPGAPKETPGRGRRRADGGRHRQSHSPSSRIILRAHQNFVLRHPVPIADGDDGETLPGPAQTGRPPATIEHSRKPIDVRTARRPVTTHHHGIPPSSGDSSMGHGGRLSVETDGGPPSDARPPQNGRPALDRGRGNTSNRSVTTRLLAPQPPSRRRLGPLTTPTMLAKHGEGPAGDLGVPRLLKADNVGLGLKSVPKDRGKPRLGETSGVDGEDPPARTADRHGRTPLGATRRRRRGNRSAARGSLRRRTRERTPHERITAPLRAGTHKEA